LQRLVRHCLLPISSSVRLRVCKYASLVFVIRATEIFAAAPEQAPPPWLERYQAAVAELRAGDVAGARAQFEVLWKANPQDVLANAIGGALDSAGRHAEATVWYQRAIGLNPHYADAYNNLALNYVARGDFPKARELLRQALKLRPSDERAYYNLGLVELRLSHFPAAAAAFLEAHKLKPGVADPLLRLAVADFKSADQKAALNALAQFERLPGDREDAALQEAQILNAAGLYGEALKQIDLFETAQPPRNDFLPLSYQKGAALFGMGRYKEAADVLIQAAPHASDPNWDLLLGSAQALAGDLPEAATTLQAAIRLASHQPEPYYRLALVLMQGYRDQDALQALASGLKEVPNSPLLWYGIGVVNQVSGRYEPAIAALRKSLDAQHDQPYVWSMLGELYRSLGQYQKAEECYQMAVSLGASPEILAGYAELLVKLRQLNEAERVLEHASAKDRDDASVDRAWGKLYNAQGQYVRAQSYLQRATSLEPGDADAHFALATCLQHLGKTAEARQEYAVADQRRNALSESTRLLRRTLVPLDESSGTE